MNFFKKPFFTFISSVKTGWKKSIKNACVSFCTKTQLEEESFKVYKAPIITCETLYEKWRKERKFPTVPHEGLRYSVKYIDTKDYIVKETPIVLAVHGAPGSYKDFSSLALHLSRHGLRFIAPSFPDFTDFKPGIFRHSAEEKAQFLKDFLKAISVSQIDALIVHSSAVYPGVHLCCDNDFAVKSFIMLNPGSHTYGMTSTKKIELLRFLCSAAENPLFLKVGRYIAPPILKAARVPVRFDDIRDPLLSATCMVHSGIPQVKEKFENLTKKKMPIFYAFSNDDKLIGKQSSLDLAYLLGASSEMIFEYNEDGSIKKTGVNSPSFRILSFERGSHYVFWRHANIINEEVSNFIINNLGNSNNQPK